MSNSRQGAQYWRKRKARRPNGPTPVESALGDFAWDRVGEETTRFRLELLGKTTAEAERLIELTKLIRWNRRERE